MKGIVLAGGSGTRLHPITLGISKQLLPIYNKPMVYYPISLLMLAGIRDILIITTPHDQIYFQRLLGDGCAYGVRFEYAIQEYPHGLAESFLIGESFIGYDDVCLVLGDNIFYGSHMGDLVAQAASHRSGASLFAYEVKDPHRYGVLELDVEGHPIGIEEKPAHPRSHLAVTGLYFYDNDVIEIAKSLTPSARGELEITDVNNHYIAERNARVYRMGRGYAWLDCGTYNGLMQASQFVQVIEERQGHMIACLEEIAYRQGFITKEELIARGERLNSSAYGQYLLEVAEEMDTTQENRELVYVE